MKNICKMIMIFAITCASFTTVSAEKERTITYQNMLKRYCINYSGDLVPSKSVYGTIQVAWGSNLSGRQDLLDIYEINMSCYDVWYENGIWVD